MAIFLLAAGVMRLPNLLGSNILSLTIQLRWIAPLVGLFGFFPATTSAIPFIPITEFEGIGNRQFHGVAEGYQVFKVAVKTGDVISVDAKIVDAEGNYRSLDILLAAAIGDMTVDIGDQYGFGLGPDPLIVALGDTTTFAPSRVLEHGVSADGEWAVQLSGYGVADPENRPWIYTLNVRVNGIAHLPDSATSLALLTLGLGGLLIVRQILSAGQ